MKNVFQPGDLTMAMFISNTEQYDLTKKVRFNNLESLFNHGQFNLSHETYHFKHGKWFFPSKTVI